MSTVKPKTTDTDLFDRLKSKDKAVSSLTITAAKQRKKMVNRFTEGLSE